MRLRAEEVSYTALVNPDEFWRKVGQLLRAKRERLGWSYPYDVEKNGGPVLSTVKQQEAGDVRTTAGLQEHCKALGITEVELFRSALDETARRPSLEAAQLLRIFEALQVPKHRRVVLEMAESLEEAEKPRGTPGPDQ